jgi:hypothetical protein
MLIFSSPSEMNWGGGKSRRRRILEGIHSLTINHQFIKEFSGEIRYRYSCCNPGFLLDHHKIGKTPWDNT